MDPAMVSAIAALLSAVVGLIAILGIKPPTRKPWLLGVGVLASVGVLLLLVSVISPPPPPGPPGPALPPAVALRDEYQRQVVRICDTDRESELQFKHQMERVSQDMGQGDLSAVRSIPSLMTDQVKRSQGLADSLEALDPPSDLRAIQSEAVSLSRKEIAVQREARDQLLKAHDELEMMDIIRRLDYKKENQLESDKDVRLRKLGGSGCNPSP
jgi:hypothetical protein